MWVIRFSIENPVKVTVAILFMVLFGFVSLRTIPIQMTPTVDKPDIRISTDYPGTAPQEVEEQITIPIEEKLQAVEGLKRIVSQSREGRSNVELEFEWGVNKDIAVIDIIRRLGRVRDLPEEAELPIVIAGTSSERRPIYWASLQGKMQIDKMRQFAKDFIVPRIERVEGVAEVRVYGGEEREIRVILDFEALGARGLTVRDVRSALSRENLNVRGGHINIGKRKYLVRTVGLFKNIKDIESVIISKGKGGATVYLRDVAYAYDTFKERSSMVRIMGRPAVAFGIVKKTGSNTIKVIEEVEDIFRKMNLEMKPKGLKIYESYDSSDYIWESINFVISNLSLGAILAVGVLILFLRSFRSTVAIGISIPIVLLSGFILLNVFDRSLNIISLAGMAFAIGMVVDNAIVVIENIYRHLQMGKGRVEAAMEGAAEVWGAVLASTLTTLAVFVPIIFVEEEAGQLFKDIAIAISCSVTVSLIVSVTVIPAFAARWLDLGLLESKRNSKFWGLLDSAAGKVSSFFVGITTWLSNGSLFKKGLVVSIITALALGTFAFAPKREYLPKGNRNLIFIFFTPHVGSSLETARKYSDLLANKVIALPEVKYMFHVVSARFNGIGVRVKDQYRLSMAKVAGKINKTIAGSPGFKSARAFQSSLFSRIFGSDMEIEVRGLDLDKIAEYSKEIEKKLFQVKGVAFARNDLELGNPEFRVVIDRERAADLNLSVQDISEVVESMVAGKKATLFKVGGDEVEIVIKGVEEKIVDAGSLEEVTVYNVNGAGIRLDSVAKVVEAIGPTQINHIEMDRAVTIKVTKKGDVPLEALVEEIDEKILNPIRQKMPPGYSISLSGHAKDLETTDSALAGSLVIAIIIIYLLMAALFESFLYPMVIMFSVPLAGSGAILAVILTESKLDVLTQLGFIILAGIVVNNAILLVHQAIRNKREYKMNNHQAITESVKTRIRPIFMSSITTILGLMPLVVRGGAGSELYSGLASAIVGGLLVSTFFTLILIPALTLMLDDIRS